MACTLRVARIYKSSGLRRIGTYSRQECFMKSTKILVIFICLAAA
jgi:hypothetical protein